VAPGLKHGDQNIGEEWKKKNPSEKTYDVAM
jgi:hypothetical protein